MILAISTASVLFSGPFGCAEDTEFFGEDVIQVSGESVYVSFPHPENYALAQVHGQDALNAQGNLVLDRCITCHSTEETEVEGAPGCKSCHAQYPHPAGFGDTGIHFQSILNMGVSPSTALQQECATSCHGSDLSGGLSGIACSDCHTLYPHAEYFSDASQHGPYFLASEGLPQNEQCDNCHRMDEVTQNGAPGCQECHSGFPHPEGWGLSNIHIQGLANQGGSLPTAISEQCATSCHGDNLNGGLSSVSCTDCHSGYPHPEGWVNPEGHGLQVLASPQTQLNACKNCHGQNFEGGQFGGSCSDCHDLPNPLAPVQHPPSQALLCGNCHATDQSEIQAPHLLKDVAPMLCSSCHAEQTAPASFTHSPTFTGSACSGCHDPHDAQEDHLLRSDETLLCLNCHDTTIQSATFGTTRNIAALYTESSNRHVPFATQDCSTCHEVHGSENNHLLNHNEAMFWIGPDTNPANSGCMDCHDLETYVQTMTFARPSIIHRPSSLLPTQFVKTNGSNMLNLHAYHVSYTLAGCLACHEPHGNDDPYLLRDYLTPYTDPGSSRFWMISDCDGCHTGDFPNGYPNNLW